MFFYLVLFGPFLAAAVSAVVVLVAPTARAVWVTVGLTLLALCWFAVPAWSLRDGLLPDSRGVLTVQRFLETMESAAIVASAIVLPAVLRYRVWQYKAQRQNRGLTTRSSGP